MALQEQALFEELAVTAQECGEAAGERDGDEIYLKCACVPGGGEREKAQEERREAQPRKHLSAPIQPPLLGEIRLSRRLEESFVHKASSSSLTDM